jgi:hypothetical protein
VENETDEDVVGSLSTPPLLPADAAVGRVFDGGWVDGGWGDASLPEKDPYLPARVPAPDYTDPAPVMRTLFDESFAG